MLPGLEIRLNETGYGYPRGEMYSSADTSQARYSGQVDDLSCSIAQTSRVAEALGLDYSPVALGGTAENWSPPVPARSGFIRAKSVGIPDPGWFESVLWPDQKDPSQETRDSRMADHEKAFGYPIARSHSDVRLISEELPVTELLIITSLEVRISPPIRAPDVHVRLNEEACILGVKGRSDWCESRAATVFVPICGDPVRVFASTDWCPSDEDLQYADEGCPSITPQLVRLDLTLRGWIYPTGELAVELGRRIEAAIPPHKQRRAGRKTKRTRRQNEEILYHVVLHQEREARETGRPPTLTSLAYEADMHKTTASRIFKDPTYMPALKDIGKPYVKETSPEES